jgi:hypothetical protein
MKSRFLLCISLILFLTSRQTPAANKKEVSEMRGKIASYHKHAPASRRKLILVYFHPNDIPPLKNYDKRVKRIILDIQNFYRAEMQRNGFGKSVFELERENTGEPLIHVVKGHKNNSEYGYNSGLEIRAEVQEALGADTPLDHNFVLIFNGLCDRDPNGTYFLHAPYYGQGNSDQISGLCHTADCELLDPLQLTNTTHWVVCREHTGQFRQTLADFNTKYLGGTAHELGHGLSLPHNKANRYESQFGTALMGAGNYTYRQELRHKKGTFLSQASATRLASHPLFTHSDFNRELQPSCRWKNLTFKTTSRIIIIDGEVAASPQGYAAIAYFDPADGYLDYDAPTAVAPIKNGKFKIYGEWPNTCGGELRVLVCHLNGATSMVRIPVKLNNQKLPDSTMLTDAWHLQEVEHLLYTGQPATALTKAKEYLPTVKDKNIAAKLKHVKNIIRPAASHPAPTAISAKSATLSDLQWISAEVGWRTPTRNHYFFDADEQHAVFLELGNNIFYPKGLYAHAPSSYVFNLGSKFKKFTATVGLQKGVSDKSEVIFKLFGDGKLLYKSQPLHDTQTAQVEADISMVNKLKLTTESTKSDNSFCWSIWGNPRISR